MSNAAEIILTLERLSERATEVLEEVDLMMMSDLTDEEKQKELDRIVFDAADAIEDDASHLRSLVGVQLDVDVEDYVLLEISRGAMARGVTIDRYVRDSLKRALEDGGEDVGQEADE